VSRWTFASCRMRRMLPTSIDGFSLMGSANGSPAAVEKARRIVRGTTMACENAVLSANQNDVEPCLIEQAAYEAATPTPATDESTSSGLFSTVASRRRQAVKGQGLNGDHRSKGRAPRGVGPRSHGRPHRFDYSDRRRNGHWEGTYRPRDSRAQRTQRSSFRKSELCGDSPRIARE
jgi:hypothetical protein